MERLLHVCVGLVYLLMVTEVVVGLECYTCADTGGNNRCEQHSTYAEAVKADETPLIKNCSNSFDEICYIERYSDRGNTVSHIRDCGDNRTFSFIGTQMDDKNAYARLKSLTANNETRCVWDGLHQVCLTKCDTNLCNGPQFENGGRALRVTVLSSLVVLLGLLRVV